MAGLPTNFQAISSVLANYNFVDIASGTGYINFYAGKTVDLKILSNNTYYSDDVYSENSTNSGTFSAIIDNDFDVLLNRPLDIKGVGIVNVPALITTSGGGVAGEFYIRATLRKWDGATETDIVTNDSDTFTDYDVYHMTAIDLTAPLTHFKIGETLRLTVAVWAKRSGGVGVTTVRCAHDPANRSASWDTTGAVPSQLIFQCPVRLNL